MKLVSLCVVTLLTVLPAELDAADDAAARLDMHRILEVTGGKGQFDEKEGVFKVSAARKDLAITVSGVQMTPPMGITSWAAFKPAGEQTTVMGDMVLLEDQVNPVMDAALEGGLEVTALHNHFLWDTPKVMFMHVAGSGHQEKLARAVGRVFTKIQETGERRATTKKVTIDPANTTLDPKKIEAIIGVAGELKDGVYKLVVGRETRMHDHEVGAAMGVNTWAAFAGSDEDAVVDGDFAMLAGEVQPVLKALRAEGIHIVALHNHMIGESPPVYFLHYWGTGSSVRLSKALRAALDLTSGSTEERRSELPEKILVDFGSDAGRPPAAFAAALTGEGLAPSWTVLEDETADGQMILAQTSADPTGGRFPLCVYESFTGRDVAVTVRLRPVSGKVDQAGGIVWRYRDPGNYYVVRANALEGNVVLYKVENGKRTDLKPVGAWPLAYGKKVEVPRGSWSELRVVARGKRHSVYFGGAHLFDVEDETFLKPGRVGLWTKADSVTHFDDFSIENLDAVPSSTDQAS